LCEGEIDPGSFHLFHLCLSGFPISQTGNNLASQWPQTGQNKHLDDGHWTSLVWTYAPFTYIFSFSLSLNLSSSLTLINQQQARQTAQFGEQANQLALPASICLFISFSPFYLSH